MNEQIFTGFDDPKDAKELVRRVLEDPPEMRWRAARAVSRVELPSVRAGIYELQLPASSRRL